MHQHLSAHLPLFFIALFVPQIALGMIDQKIPNDIFYVIFEYGTERINRALRCTSKTIYNIGEQYRDNQVKNFDANIEKTDWTSLNLAHVLRLFSYRSYKSITIDTTRIGDSLKYYLPSLIILPGGKEYRVIAYDRMGTCLYYEAEGAIKNLIVNIQTSTCQHRFFTATDPKKQYRITMCFQDDTAPYYRTVEITNGKKIKKIAKATLAVGGINFTKYPFVADFQESQMSHSDKTILESGYINTHRVSALFFNKKYQINTHESVCLLSNKTIPYIIFHNKHAKNEYIFDNSTTYIEPIKSNECFSYLNGIKEHTISTYKIKKDSILNDHQAQKYFYDTLKIKNNKLIAQSSRRRDLIGCYTAWVLFGTQDNVTRYDAAIKKAIFDTQQTKRNAIIKLTYAIPAWLIGIQTYQYTNNENIDLTPLVQKLQQKLPSFDDYCKQVSDFIDEQV